MTNKTKSIVLGTIVTVVTLPLLTYVCSSLAGELKSKANKADVVKVEKAVEKVDETKASKESVKQTIDVVKEQQASLKESLTIYKESLEDTRREFRDLQNAQQETQEKNDTKFYILLEQIDKTRGGE